MGANLASYIKSHGISLRFLSRSTGIPYGIICRCLSPSRNRELRANEFCAICIAIDKNPMDFAPKEEPEQEGR